jgi:small multidrug resistance pump
MQYHPLLTMLIAIVLELVGTTALKLTDGGVRPLWYLPVAVGYVGSFYLFSNAIRSIPLGMAYAMWAGLGIAGTALVGAFLFRQHLAPVNIIGISLILFGTVLVNAGSARV